ncbi:oxygenase MpaB family protein [Streptomyces flaveus]|uniref:oxygenase MpaB family protein n=1 Tax=Streptomyces flaveus TaxID=66370 RepID=UPI003319FFD3
MTTNPGLPHAEFKAADTPADLKPGRLLGRTVNYEQAVGKFGRKTVEHIAAHYNVGDELGYRAYVALREKAPKGSAKETFDEAVAQGIGAVPDPPAELVALFEHVDQVPDWVDWDQLRRGSIAYWRAGKLVVMGLAYAAIGAGFRTYGGSRELVMSRRLIEPDQVGRRLIETLRWAANASKPDGMRRSSDGFRITMQVRWIHAAVRYHCSRDKHWDWDDWGISVDNTDAVYTMGTLFAESVIRALDTVGVRLSAREREDVVALWRYVGHVMGIPEDINFTDWADLQRKSAIIRMLEHPADDGCRTLLDSLVTYMCEAEIEGFQILPAFLDARLTQEKKRTLTNGLMRAWAGDEICDQLAVPDNKLRYLVPAAKPFVTVYDKVTRKILKQDDEAKALRALREFGVALTLHDGETEVADPDDVVRGLARNSGSTGEILGR